jgi:Flp pilus assembly protein TadD
MNNAEEIVGTCSNPSVVAVALSRGNYSSAEAHLLQRERLLKRRGQPVPPSLLQLLGIVAFRQGKYEESETYYRQIVENGSADPVVLNSMGLSLCAQGKRDQAKVFCHMAEQLRDSIADDGQITLNDLADVYCACGTYQEAEKLCELALSVAEHDLQCADSAPQE